MELFHVPLTSARQEMFAGFSFWCNIEWFLGESTHALPYSDGLYLLTSPRDCWSPPPSDAHRTTHFPRTRPTHKCLRRCEGHAHKKGKTVSGKNVVSPPILEPDNGSFPVRVDLSSPSPIFLGWHFSQCIFFCHQYSRSQVLSTAGADAVMKYFWCLF